MNCREVNGSVFEKNSRKTGVGKIHVEKNNVVNEKLEQLKTSQDEPQLQCSGDALAFYGAKSEL